MKVYNTLTQKKEHFQPIGKKTIKMYLCGPTVYDLGHLGHARSAVSFDMIRKYFKYKGYDVIFVSNYTDIDDKMIDRAKKERISVKELAQKIIPEYQSDYQKLLIEKPTHSPKATEFIPEMIEIIKKLEKNGHTYELKDGIYFDIETFSEYGKLSHQKIEELRCGVRKEEDKNKRNPQDFVLWKKAKQDEPSWPSPWGDGRPGWHIECSAMSAKLLGQTFDIHAGGADLIFPHHEDEIAQSEAANKKTFAHYWLHNGFIQIDNEKMSKSLGNFFTIRDILKEYHPQAVRYFLIATHYRGPINFTKEQLDQAENTLQGLREFKRRLKNLAIENNYQTEKTEANIQKCKKSLEEALDDDFETPRALSALFEFIKEINQQLSQSKISKSDAAKIGQFLALIDQIFNIMPALPEETVTNQQRKFIEQKITERNLARKNKDWQKSDQIREELARKGIELEDLGHKTTWKIIT